MTEIITPAELQAGTIAAYRYLAFLDAERRMLLSEIQPGVGNRGRYSSFRRTRRSMRSRSPSWTVAGRSCGPSTSTSTGMRPG